MKKIMSGCFIEIEWIIFISTKFLNFIFFRKRCEMTHSSQKWNDSFQSRMKWLIPLTILIFHFFFYFIFSLIDLLFQSKRITTWSIMFEFVNMIRSMPKNTSFLIIFTPYSRTKIKIYMRAKWNFSIKKVQLYYKNKNKK